MKLLAIVISVLALVGCVSLIPTDERTIELPTEKYRQPQLTAKEAILKIKESCDRFGRFHVDGERYTCHEG